MTPTATPTDDERSLTTRVGKDMDGYKVFRQAVPENDLWAIRELSKLMKVSIDTIYRWMRQPSTAKKPKSTGRRNPIDYAGQLLVALYGVSPEKAELVFDAFDDLRAELRARHGLARKVGRGEMKNNLRRIGREASQMADSIVAGETE